MESVLKVIPKSAIYWWSVFLTVFLIKAFRNVAEFRDKKEKLKLTAFACKAAFNGDEKVRNEIFVDFCMIVC
jgi:hypothetical protein